MKNSLFLIFFVFLTSKIAQSNTNENIKNSICTNTNTAELVAFAKNLIGIPYQFGASNPRTGFDCSGFVHYVFKHFGMNVPRQSAAFKNEGKTIRIDEAIPGDVILFTGTSPRSKAIGHIGIVTFREGQTLHFVHASSGSVRKVVETPLNNRYKNRFVKIIRLI